VPGSYNPSEIPEFSYKLPCRVASTADIDLSVAADPNPIDGVTLVNDDCILLWKQSTGSENGPYKAVDATDPTKWIRTDDANTSAKVFANIAVIIEEGTLYQDKMFVLTTDNPIVLGTTSLTFNILEATDSTAIHDNIASEISAIAEKTEPTVGDLVIVEDVAAANIKKKVQLGNISPLVRFLSKSATYTTVAGDNGKLILFTSGSGDLDLTAAATLGSGWSIYVRNESAEVYSVDPNGSENIDGGSLSIPIPPGQGFHITCDGTAFYTIGRERVVMSVFDNVDHTAPADTNENSLATVTIPANLMATNCVVEIYWLLLTNSNSNAKTATIKLGTTVYKVYDFLTSVGGGLKARIFARNATNSQIGNDANDPDDHNKSTFAIITSTEDSTSDVVIDFIAQKAVSGDSMVSKSIHVKIFNS